MNEGTALVVIFILISGVISYDMYSSYAQVEKMTTLMQERAYYYRVSMEIINSGVLDNFFSVNDNGAGIDPFNPKGVAILNNLSQQFHLSFQVNIDGVTVYRSPGFIPSGYTIEINYFYIAPDLTLHNLTIDYGT